MQIISVEPILLVTTDEQDETHYIRIPKELPHSGWYVYDVNEWDEVTWDEMGQHWVEVLEAEVAAILCNRNDCLEHEVMALNARIAELEGQLQNSPDYRTLIRFPTAE